MRTRLLCLLFSAATILVVTGCAPNLSSSIDECVTQGLKGAPLPIDEFQRVELQERQQGAFYRCMKAKGFKEDESYAEQLRYLALKSPTATGTDDERLAKLNRMRTQEMYRSGSGFWIR